VLLWLGTEVQEVSRSLTATARLRDLVLLVIAAVLGLSALVAYATFRIWQQGGRDDHPKSGAIVVLGAAQFNGRPSPVYAARLDWAVTLYQQGTAKLVVMTGGKAEGDRTTEAAAGRDYAIARGVPESAIVMEDRGRTTLESLDGVASILQRHGVPDAVFVSDPTHMLRVLRIATDLGIVAWGSPTPTSLIETDVGSKVDATIHELGGLALYFFARGAPAEGLAPNVR
jgi:uncharacterized SAM-binding protein YcdF (DUF218 family)